MIELIGVRRFAVEARGAANWVLSPGSADGAVKSQIKIRSLHWLAVGARWEHPRLCEGSTPIFVPRCLGTWEMRFIWRPFRYLEPQGILHRKNIFDDWAHGMSIICSIWIVDDRVWWSLRFFVLLMKENRVLLCISSFEVKQQRGGL
jgi:hypothetical protein